MPIDFNIGGYSLQKCIYSSEVKAAVRLYNRLVFHGIAGRKHLEVLVSYLLVLRIADILVGAQSQTEIIFGVYCFAYALI